MVVAPLMALVLPPRIGLGLMLPLLMATDVMALVHYRGRWDRRSVAALLPPALVGIGLGGYLLRGIAPGARAPLVGLAALGFAPFQVYPLRPPPSPKPPRLPALGGRAVG